MFLHQNIVPVTISGLTALSACSSQPPISLEPPAITIVETPTTSAPPSIAPMDRLTSKFYHPNGKVSWGRIPEGETLIFEGISCQETVSFDEQGQLRRIAIAKEWTCGGLIFPRRTRLSLERRCVAEIELFSPIEQFFHPDNWIMIGGVSCYKHAPIVVDTSECDSEGYASQCLRPFVVQDCWRRDSFK